MRRSFAGSATPRSSTSTFAAHQTVDRVAFGVRLPGQRTAAQVEPHAVAPFEAVFVDAGETQPEAVTAVRAFDIGRAEILAEIHLVPGDIGVELHVLRAVVADDKGFELRTGSQSHRAARSLGPQRREIVGPHARDGGKAEQGRTLPFESYVS